MNHTILYVREHLILILLLLLAAACSPSPAQQNAKPDARSSTQAAPLECSSSVACPGESLLYQVSYAGIKLGKIHIITEAADTSATPLFHGKSLVDSYKGVPFVEIHVIDSSVMDTGFYSRGYKAFEKNGDHWVEEKTRYDFANMQIIIERTKRQDPQSPPLETPTLDTLHLTDTAFVDGLSIFFFARAHARTTENMKVPAVVLGKRGFTEFHFGTERNTEEIDALKDQKIRVVKLEGKADFVGLAGMTGDFSGWFSDDPASIPIKAQLGVFIGNINIELVKWTRKGWEPPVEK